MTATVRVTLSAPLLSALIGTEAHLAKQTKTVDPFRRGGTASMMRTMRWPVFAVILLALLLLPVIAQAQHKWSGAIIGTSRAIDWTNAGLTATLPDGKMAPNPWIPPTRSTICKTLTTSSFPGMSSTNPFADSTEDQ